MGYFQPAAETFRSCAPCDDNRMRKDGTVVINPFVWPYSGAQCIDDLYILNNDSGVNLSFTGGPLMHLHTPDHVAMVN